MKLLSNEQQSQLRELIEQAATSVTNIELRSQLTYWGIELKPKRVRKQKLVDNTSSTV